MKSLLSLIVMFLSFIGIVLAQKEQVTIRKTFEVPIIDGIEDSLWQLAEPNYLNKNFIKETPTIIAYWKMLWSDNYIYILVNVDDDNHWPAWESGGNRWEYDNVELYFDVNEVLKDGIGAGTANTGHWQCAPGFDKDKYRIVNYFNDSPSRYISCDYSYQLLGEGYIYEWKMPLENLWDKNQVVLTPANIINRDIGFDVTVVDQDEGVTTSRQRKSWQNNGSVDENWNNMDGAGIIRFEETEFASDSVVCGTNISLAFKIDVTEENISEYNWNLDGGVMLNSFKNNCTAKWNEPGTKRVVLTVKNANKEQFQFVKNIIVYPTFTVDLGEDISTCKNTEIQLTPSVTNGIEPLTFYWDDQIGNNTHSETLNQNKQLSLKVEDHVGCMATSSIFLSIASVTADQICKLTIVNGNNDLKIEWVKSLNDNIKEYQILKESNVANKYDIIGTVAYTDNNYFIDKNSNASKYASKYIIKTVDKCGNISNPSSHHKNIHLQVSPGLSGYYNLSWTPYVGFDYGSYFIYKGNSLENMKLIDQVSSSLTQYTDTSSTQVYYQVAVWRNEPCEITTDKSINELAEARSNIENAKTSSSQQIDSESFNAYPNPTKGIINLSFNISNNMTYQVNDISGKLAKSGRLNSRTIDISELELGQYFILISENDNRIVTFQIQKE